MKAIMIAMLLAALTGCSVFTAKDQMYYDTSKALSRDQTVAQSACWGAIGEIAKGSSDSVKIGAITLAEKCKSEPVTVQPPIKNWYGL